MNTFIDIPIFDQNTKFLERIKVNNNSYEENIINFHILSTDKLESEIIHKLQTGISNSEKYISLPLIMWGREEFNLITYTTQGRTIKLLQIVADLIVEYHEVDNKNSWNAFNLIETAI